METSTKTGYNARIILIEDAQMLYADYLKYIACFKAPFNLFSFIYLVRSIGLDYTSLTYLSFNSNIS